MANTLLGYFKDRLTANGCTTKYFNRDFLQTFCKAYKERSYNLEHGIVNDFTSPEYEYNAVMGTKFYNLNGSAYCVFQEEWNAYKKGMEYLNKVLAH